MVHRLIAFVCFVLAIIGVFLDRDINTILLFLLLGGQNLIMAKLETTDD